MNHAPPGCIQPLCAHLERRPGPHDQCRAGVPMHDHCPYHVTPAQMAAKEAQKK